MDYFEKRFQQVLDNFSFSRRVYRHDRMRCEQCYQASLGELDDIFNRHDRHDSFSKRLMDCRDRFKRQMKKEYLGI